MPKFVFKISMNFVNLNVFWVNVQNSYVGFVTNSQGRWPKANLIEFACPNWCDGPYNGSLNIYWCIVVMDLFCNTSHCALKNINVIYRKNKWVFWQYGLVTTHHLLVMLLITLVRLSLLDLTTNEMKIGILTQFSTTY